MGCSIKSYSRQVPITNHPNANIVVQATNFVIENENSFHDIYRLGKLLGTGSFGEVRLCVHRETSIKRAVKIIRKDLLTSPKQRENLDNEIRTLKKSEDFILSWNSAMVESCLKKLSKKEPSVKSCQLEL